MKPQDLENKGSEGSDKNKVTGNTDTSKGFQGSDKNKGSGNTGSEKNKGSGDFNKGVQGSTNTGSTSSTSDTSKDRTTTRPYRSGGRDTGSGSDEGILSNIGTKGLLGALGAVAGGALLIRALTGSSKSTSKKSSSTGQTVEADNKITIKRSREELYSYWRNLENLPNFMSHLKEVRELDERTSTWVARIPGGLGTVEWDSEIVQERPNHLIVWRSLPGSEIENSGEVRFEEAPGGKGTIVETTINYSPPAGEAGNYVAKLLNPAFEKTVKNDLKEFKKLMEKGGAAKRKSKPSTRV